MICEAKISDVGFLAVGMRELIEHVQRSGDDYFAELQDGYQDGFEGWFEEAIKNKEATVLIAWENASPVGFIAGQIEKPFLPFCRIERVGQIEGCWIKRAARRKGIGNKLVEAIERWFAQRKIDYVQLNYITGNVEAKAFWKKLGYRPYRVATRKKLDIQR